MAGKKGRSGNRLGTSGVKFSDTQREEVKERVAALERQGFNQFDIAAKVGVTQPQVSQYLKQIREEYQRRSMVSRAEAVAEKLEQYRDVRRVAWLGYELSMEDGRRRVVEYAPPPRPSAKKARGKGGSDDADPGSYDESLRRIRLVATREGRLPANEFLNTILNTLKAECALLGLDEQPAGGARVGVQVNNTGGPAPPSLKDILDAAREQAAVGRTPAPPPQLTDGKNGGAG